MADLDGIERVEHAAFASDHMSRRTLRRFLGAPSATMLIAERDGAIVGAALVLVRRTSDIARLYSIAVDPAASGLGIGRALLAASEHEARRKGRARLRLEVHVRNDRAIALYRTAGYREFGRHVAYYHDSCDALRFEKPLWPDLRSLVRPRAA